MGLKLSNFLSDPFAITTVCFGVIAWIIAIAGAGASGSATYLRFTWWGLVYEILLIIGIFLLYLNNNIELYKFTLVGLLSVAIVYTTNSTNTLVYNLSSAANLTCAAGCILLLMLNILWVVYFGGHPESPTNQFIDSFSTKNNTYSHGQLPSATTKVDDNDNEFTMPTSTSQAFAGDSRQSHATHNNKSAYMASSHLNGLENFSNSHLNSQSARNTVYNTGTGAASRMDDGTLAAPVTTFSYKAKALYSYDASPEDANEISFVKGEILEVDDIGGKWWQAKKADGQVGICPSNYVKLLE
ncbi:hypothetical protein METBIDRAFT_139156 [Metschnikowia bicuspidata var. bicuspidata NRRL YB-4993]|uniref:High osmolarity signaling protein SHO1 n=1 Tax=Metschnikowia bicuspidata var. bicuspidata NRRL YB-4993 TaxID=869754 RepID=A0A1A0HD27_9ASCO|nr:hypothetical protein METBIDRAFT_139156 [Metschnikowia bicuspidata var. bicuspidata NRRL YB-4993]OBA21880.1 hypothetical protein METBIDRAFT_139156 [Metschnikowia bicuspidata var. bicuspidata NRRL YB-4993]